MKWNRTEQNGMEQDGMKSNGVESIDTNRSVEKQLCENFSSLPNLKAFPVSPTSASLYERNSEDLVVSLQRDFTWAVPIRIDTAGKRLGSACIRLEIVFTKLQALAKRTKKIMRV